MDDNIQQNKRHGYRDDEDRDLALAPMPCQKALLVGRLLLDIFGAIAMDEQPVVVHAVRRAGHKRELVGPRLNGQRFDLVGLEVFEHRKFAQMGELLPAAFHGRYFTSATQTYALAMCQYARG